MLYNYGPWDRLAENEPFVAGFGPKPPGANLYPANLTKEEFEEVLAADPERAAELRSLYSLVRRDESGELIAVPYRKPSPRSSRLPRRSCGPPPSLPRIRAYDATSSCAPMRSSPTTTNRATSLGWT